MLRALAWSVLLLLALAMPATDVMAQSSAGRGAVGGAIIGGAVGGRRGAAIGAATGAVVGANRDRRRAHYYWHHGRCWVRSTEDRIPWLPVFAGRGASRPLTYVAQSDELIE